MTNDVDFIAADDQLIKAMAMDIGKEVASHIRIMYKPAAKELGKSGLLSIRNCVYNQIMASIAVIDSGEIGSRIEIRKKRRRDEHKAWNA